MNVHPTISVLMGVRDGAPYLREAIASILEQTFSDLELIVVDDASSDETPNILAACRDSRLVVLENEENLGLTRSLNRALVAARGRYVARQDADDRSLPARLERQVAFLESHPHVWLCGTWVWFVDGDGHFLGAGHPPTDPEELARLLPLGAAQPYHGTVLARREFMEDLAGYREAFHYAQDYDLYLRAIGQNALANVPEELYEFRFHGATVSTKHQELQERYAALARELWAQRREQGQDELDRGVPVETLLERVAVAPPGPETWSHRAIYRGLTGDLRGYRSALIRLIRMHPADPRPYIRLALSLAGRRAVQRGERAWRQRKFRALAAQRQRQLERAQLLTDGRFGGTTP